jgi:hypothetical protein
MFLLPEKKQMSRQESLVRLREVSSRFSVFGLLFGEEAGQGDDVGLDLLFLHVASFSIALA